MLGDSPSTTLRAYGHDNKYVAFHQPFTDSRVSPAVTYQGFVYDLSTGQLSFHDLSCAAAYPDPVNDHLYLSDAAGALRRWGEGDPVGNARWRSKRFSLPQITGFACAQVEAERYTGLKCQLYRDGTKVNTELTAAGDAVASATPPRIEGRYPFRLEAQQGRDWEVDLNPLTQEVFNVVLAQSMAEIGTA